MLDKDKKKECVSSQNEISEEICKKMDASNKLLFEERIHESPIFKQVSSYFNCGIVWCKYLQFL